MLFRSQSCPDVVQALNAMAALNPKIRHTMIDGAVFPAEVEKRQIMAVPAVYLNGAPFGQGRMELNEIVAKLDTGAAERESARIGAKAPFDVLVVGGGPAGAAAAIYAARKGIRTGIAAERLPRIFDRFSSFSDGGSGLGLALVRRLVESLGGQIAVESRLGHGTTFRFTLPVAAVEVSRHPVEVG